MSGRTEKKYEFTGETMCFEGHTLKRIRYVKDGVFFNRGDVGGWIESEENLSHKDHCCVLEESKIFGNASVKDNARVVHNSIVKDNAKILDCSFVYDEAIVGADTIVKDISVIGKGSKVYFYNTTETNSEQGHITGNTCILNNSIFESTGYVKSSEFLNCTFYGVSEFNVCRFSNVNNSK